MNKWIIYVLATLMMLFARSVFAGSVQGELRWLQRVELGFAVSGVITEVPARTGVPVMKGAVLATLDNRSFEAEVKRGLAEKIHSRKLLEEARRELDRAKELYERTVLSDHELQLAHIGYTDASAQHQKASAHLVRAQLELDYSSIKAPFDGMVINKTAEAGKTVIASLTPESQFVFAASGRMLVHVNVDIDTASRLVNDAEIEVEVAGEELRGRIYHIGLEPVQGSQRPYMYPVDVVFDVPANVTLRAGMQAEVDLP